MVPINAAKAVNQTEGTSSRSVDKLVHAHVVVWDGGSEQEFGRGLWVVIVREVDIPTPSSRESGESFQ